MKGTRSRTCEGERGKTLRSGTCGVFERGGGLATPVRAPFHLGTSSVPRAHPAAALTVCAAWLASYCSGTPSTTMMSPSMWRERRGAIAL